jgi:hypothetical protein
MVGIERPARATAEDLVAVIERRVGRRVRGLSVTVDEGGGTILGWADCYHTKQLAQHRVLEAGALVKANLLRVGPDPSAPGLAAAG